MNAITREIVTNTALNYPEAAQENGSEFAFLVRSAHRDYILAQFEPRYIQRAMFLFRALRPDLFSPTSDLELMDHIPGMLEIYLAVYQRAINVIERKIARDDELKLETWEHPSNYETYQMEMF